MLEGGIELYFTLKNTLHMLVDRKFVTLVSALHILMDVIFHIKLCNTNNLVIHVSKLMSINISLYLELKIQRQTVFCADTCNFLRTLYAFSHLVFTSTS
jgi:hypothetical protein